MNRVSSAGEMSASIAHEMRQPLAAITMSGTAALNWLKRLKEQSPEVDQVRGALQIVINEGHRADAVIKSIRAMFKNDPPTRKTVNLNELVQQVTALTAASIKSDNIILNVHSAGDLPPLVTGDPIQLQQVILNLVMNAVEAMSHSKEGGRTLLLTTQSNPGGTVLLTVADLGPAVDLETVQKNVSAVFHDETRWHGNGTCHLQNDHRGTWRLAGGKAKKQSGNGISDRSAAL